MALSDGDDAVLDDNFAYQQYNRLKNHFAGATAPSNPSAGMIWNDTDDNKTYIYDGAAWQQIYTADNPMARDKIEEGDSSVEVIDAGTGYIETKADNQQVRKDQVAGNIQPLQPAFLTYLSGNQSNFAITSWVTIQFDTEIFDQGADFNTGTYTFTAPVTGKYRFNFIIRLDNLDKDAHNYDIALVTSNKTYYPFSIRIEEFGSDVENWNWSGGILVDMDASDTAYVQVYQNGGAQQTDVHLYSHFSGKLEC